jgi:hypothetical protein
MTLQANFHKTALTVGGLLAAAGGVLWGIGFTQGAEAAWHAYFFGWMIFTGAVFGCTGLQLLHHATRAKWSAPLLRLWEAGGGPVMLLASLLLFLPIALQGPTFYHWLDPEHLKGDPIYEHRNNFFGIPWISFPVWMAKSVIYYVVLIALTGTMSSWLKKEEATLDPKWSQKRHGLAGWALVLYVLVVNFSMTDWAMNLGEDGHWFSTIYGVWLMIGFIIFSLSFAVVVFTNQSEREPYDQVASPNLFKDHGHLLMAFMMIWAYFSLSQYLIIYSGNLPEFTQYYLRRNSNGFGVFAGVMIVLHFFLPWLIVMQPKVKRSAKLLGWVAGYMLVMRVFDLYFVIKPALVKEAGIIPSLAEIGAAALFPGLFCIGFALLVQRAPLLTETHPSENPDEPRKEALAHV